MEIKELKEVNTIEELKVIGSVQEIITIIEEIIKPLKIQATTYEEIFGVITLLKSKWSDFIDGYFKDKQEEYIFYLTELEGKQRNKKLGITDRMYEDKTMAKKWYNSIAKKVHPDKCCSMENANNAFNVLNEIYKIMCEE